MSDRERSLGLSFAARRAGDSQLPLWELQEGPAVRKQSESTEFVELTMDIVPDGKHQGRQCQSLHLRRANSDSHVLYCTECWKSV